MHLALFAALCWLFGSLTPSPAHTAETDTQVRGEPGLAFVTVAGAPGDGELALAAALSRRLTAAGLKPATAFQANVYEIQGTVRVTDAARGKQSVRIVWVVLGPDGTQLGVVRQTKEVRTGSLDRKWGAAAAAAANAAANDIIKLLPRQ